MARLALCLLLLCALAACHRHHHGLPQVIPCPGDKDSASPAGEGHHQHDPCSDEEEE